MPQSAALPHLRTRRGNNEIRDSNITKLEVVTYENRTIFTRVTKSGLIIREIHTILIP